MDEHYKSLHEKFVENNEGSKDPWEILLISLILPASSLLSQILRPFFSPRIPFLLETSLLSLPILLAITCCSEKSLWILLALLGSSAGILYLKAFRKLYIPWSKIRESFLSSGDSKKALFDSLNAYRGNLLLVTCLTILAVDFPVFPRRLMKTEAYGYGFMDVGVGSFVFANGILAHEARHALAPNSVGRRLCESLKSSSYLFVLGLVRLASVKALNYQEHVTEYGVHWNFFFTLAAVKVTSTICLCFISPKNSWLISLFLGLMHEGILSTSIGATYILDPQMSRDDIFSANREGIVSLLGYIAIYLGAVYWGIQVQSCMTTNGGSMATCVSLLKSLVLWSIVMWGSLLYSQELFLLPSRRMANWPYFNWMMAFNLTQLAVFLLFNLIGICFQNLLSIQQDNTKSSRNGKSTKGGKGPNKRRSSLPHPPSKAKDSQTYVSNSSSSFVLDAIAFNGLPYFLLSNVLTGVVNICFQTIYMMNCYAILILFVYCFSLNYLAVLLFDKKIRWKG